MSESETFSSAAVFQFIIYLFSGENNDIVLLQHS